MTSLPEHWESDYDGNRWFYRYKPTGIIQYTFPKPGDEFPEYIDASAPRVPLPPEEKLVSQQQLRRRNTAERKGSQASTRTKDDADEVTSATLSKGEGGGFWFQPDYMYLGDISPLQEEIEEELRIAREQQAREKKESAAQQSPGQDSAQPHVSLSPLTSAGTTPLTGTSKPATGTPDIDDATVASRNSPGPVGFVAELPSEITAQCREETHPAPVELPGHHHNIAAEENPSRRYTVLDAFDIAPAELPAHSAVPPRPENSEKPRRPQAQPIQPSADLVSASKTEPQTTQSTGDVASTVPSFHSYKPNQRAMSEYNINRRSQVMSYYSAADSQNTDYEAMDKRHSLAAGAGPPVKPPQDVPSVLRPPLPPPKRPLDTTESAQQPPNTPFLAKTTVGSRVPSVLQPARGRPHIPVDTSQGSQRPSPLKAYQPYSPQQERQGSFAVVVESQFRAEQHQRAVSVQPIQRPPQNHGPDSSLNARPVASRTNTLPLHMPSIPFMGVGTLSSFSGPDETSPERPVQAHSTQNDRQTVSHDTKPSVKPEVDLSAYMSYSNRISPSDPDLPRPLSITRLPVVGRVAELANTTASFELPASAGSDTSLRGALGPIQESLLTDKRAGVSQTTSPKLGKTTSHDQQQEIGVSHNRPPLDRPPTAFSVVSDLSVLSEPISSPPSQRSFKQRVEDSLSPALHAADKPAGRPTPGSETSKAFVVEDGAFLVSSPPQPLPPNPGVPASMDTASLGIKSASSAPSNGPLPSTVDSARRRSSASATSEQYSQDPATPPPAPHFQRLQGNQSQSPRSQTSSPSADHKQKKPSRLQSSRDAAGEVQYSTPQPSRGSQAPAEQGAPRLTSISSLPSGSQANAPSPYGLQPQGIAHPGKGQDGQIGTRLSYTTQPTQPPPANQSQYSQQHHLLPQNQPQQYSQLSGGWQPQIPRYAQVPPQPGASKPIEATRLPSVPEQTHFYPQAAPNDAKSSEPGRRHSASVGPSMAPHVMPMYNLQGGQQPPIQYFPADPTPRAESVPADTSHHPAHSRPMISFSAATGPQQVGPGLLGQGLGPGRTQHQPLALPTSHGGQASVGQPTAPSKANVPGEEKRRNKLQKPGGLGTTGSSSATAQSRPGAPINGSANAPTAPGGPHVLGGPVRTAQGVKTPAHSTSPQQPVPVQGPQRPQSQNQQGAPPAFMQQNLQQPAEMIQFQSYPASTTGQHPHAGSTPFHGPMYQVTFAVKAPPGGQAVMQQTWQQTGLGRVSPRQSYPSAQVGPAPQTMLPNQAGLRSSQTRPVEQHPAQQHPAPQQPVQQQPIRQQPIQQQSTQQQPLQQQPIRQQPIQQQSAQQRPLQQQPTPQQPVQQQSAQQQQPLQQQAPQQRPLQKRPPQTQPQQHQQPQQQFILPPYLQQRPAQAQASQQQRAQEQHVQKQALQQEPTQRASQQQPPEKQTSQQQVPQLVFLQEYPLALQSAQSKSVQSDDGYQQNSSRPVQQKSRQQAPDHQWEGPPASLSHLPGHQVSNNQPQTQWMTQAAAPQQSPGWGSGGDFNITQDRQSTSQVQQPPTAAQPPQKHTQQTLVQQQDRRASSGFVTSPQPSMNYHAPQQSQALQKPASEPKNVNIQIPGSPERLSKNTSQYPASGQQVIQQPPSSTASGGSPEPLPPQLNSIRPQQGPSQSLQQNVPPQPPQQAQQAAPSGVKDKTAALQIQTQPVILKEDNTQPRFKANFARTPLATKPSDSFTTPQAPSATQPNAPQPSAPQPSAPQPSAPQPAQKASGWGDSSGYDGSGWGDDDDDYY